MMMDFRLMWLKGEPTNAESIFDLLSRRVRRDTTEGQQAANLIEQLSKELKRALEAPAMGPECSPDPNEGSDTESRTAEQVISDWMSAGMFHGDRTAPAQRVRMWDQETYEFVLIKVVNRISNIWLALCVLADQVLSDQADQRSFS